MSVLIQDGRRGGHVGWATASLGTRSSSGVVISPFHTPRLARPRHRAASDVAQEVLKAGGEAIFDATTHARLHLGTNDLMHYNTWQLWGPAGVGLDTDDRRLQHVEQVFQNQTALRTPILAPTLSLESATGDPATAALETARAAAALNSKAWQSLAGTRSFFRDGVDLDTHVGQLASLRSSTWAVTLVNGVIVDNAPDYEDSDALVGLLRTVHSLSLRSRVILLHADLGGLAAVAAGANTLGGGWDRGMRYFDPESFRVSSGSPRIAASYVTQGGLVSVLKRTVADALVRIPSADLMRGGRLPADDAAEREHHLTQLTRLTDRVAAHGINRRARVAEARAIFEQAMAWWDAANSALPRSTMPPAMRTRWLQQPYNALKLYAEAESLW